MVDSNADETPLEAVAGGAGPNTTEAFQLLSDETRLGILFALWDEYDPAAPEEAVSFSTTMDRVGVRDSGHFTYHLNELLGHYVEETAEGYRLRNAGFTIVQAVIAGAGLEERTLAPTEIDMSCTRCGAPVELSYEDEYLHHICTECEGNTGPNFAEERPVGTLMRWDFNPAGLAGRTPDEVFVAGIIKALRDFGLLVRGLCPQCTGAVDRSLHICDEHEPGPGEACPTCGTLDEIRLRFVCSVCKFGDSYPVDAFIYDHPGVVAFCHEHGIEHTFGLDDPEACADLWEHLTRRDHRLLSEDPVRIRVTVPGDEETLHLTLDGDLDVLDVRRVTEN